MDNACELPDACGNDVREEKLLARQANDDRSWLERVVDRERNLILCVVAMALLMNVSTGRYILYPFQIFSTWIHEMCHGTAALLVGGKISKLQIFEDGSGLAYTSTSGETWKKAFVASAGYPGTAVTGCLLLLFRRTTLGPTIGTLGLGAALCLSCLIYVRNTFGAVMLTVEGVVLLVCGWKLPATWLDHLYSFLAATCCMNSATSIRDLFSTSQGYAGGKAMESDAHAVADYLGLTYIFWATLWFVQAMVMTAVGILFARNARVLSSSGRRHASSTPHDSNTPSNLYVAQVV